MLINKTDINIRSATNADRQRIANLIHFGSHVHQHLDWLSPLDWIGREPYLVLENIEGLVGTLACPPDIPEITWIRLFAISSKIQLDEAWRLLWEHSLDGFKTRGKIKITALSMQNWFSLILEGSNFKHTDNVIVLITELSEEFREPPSKSIRIRQMLPEDLYIVLDIDHAAFSLEWRNSREALETAFHQSSYPTVAEVGDELAGYQYSTSSGMSGHLARLAVKEHMQRRGIGYSLVHDVVQHFQQNGVKNISVNTQESNHKSISLYARAGFKLTGEAYRVYQYIL
jgi:ribosomal protein S18 acetylase RimI-like enzyme